MSVVRFVSQSRRWHVLEQRVVEVEIPVAGDVDDVVLVVPSRKK